ncbi:MAG: hypothetical protein KF763_06920 [Cyclobacteriaceae bacterium]|jgi:hypothetical protein|nr:hypothetical protein [Cyclobacteriaceae bacterium]
MLQSPKLAILQSLDAMDKVQMEEVLTYIKGILNQPVRTSDYQAFKKEAMKEIRQALRQEKGRKKLRLAV